MRRLRIGIRYSGNYPCLRRGSPLGGSHVEGGSLGKTREIINSPSKLGVMYGLVELDHHSLGACVPGLTT